jgi:hypothetical protein
MEEVCPPKILTEQTNLIFSHVPKTLSLVKLYTFCVFGHKSHWSRIYVLAHSAVRVRYDLFSRPRTT